MEDLKKLLAAATPLPWFIARNANTVGDCTPEDAALIVAAVNALPELLAIKAERDRAQRACEQMGKRITSLESLISVLLENNPSDAVSDGGHTVLDLWLYHARAALNQEPGQ